MGRNGVALLLGWVLGVALQLQQAQLGSSWHDAGLLWLGISLGVAVLVWQRKSRAAGSAPAHRPLAMLLVLAASLSAGALGGWGLTGVRAAQFASEALDPGLQGLDIEVTGRIASLPQRTAQGERFQMVVESATRHGEALPLPTRLQLGWYGGAHSGRGNAAAWSRGVDSPGVRAGERWRFTVRLRSPHGNANPHGFDLERWLWARRIGATGYVRNGQRDPAPEKLDASSMYPVQAARQSVRDAIGRQVSDGRTAGVLVALLVGDQGAIERADWALFRTTGVAHLMVISGLHVTLFAWMAMALVGALWPRLGRYWPSLLLAVPTPVARAVGGVLLALAYALFAGWGLPAQRAVVMLAVVMGLRLGVRHWPWPLVWLCAMVAVLLIDPMALLQPGFWLSFVAVGILFASGQRLPVPPPQAAGRTGAGVRHGLERAARATGSLVRTQAVVTLALAPLTLLLFGQFSLSGLVANLVAIPVVTQLVMPLVLLGTVLPPLWDLAAWLVQALSVVLAWLAEWPWAAVHRPAAPLGLALAGVLGGVLLVLRLPWAVRGAGLLLIWPVLLWTPPRPAPGQFELLALDVGQGSAVLVRTARHSLLYDTGPRYSPDSDAGERVVVPLLRALGARPDAVVVSHRDSDHAGGSGAVRAAHPQARWLSSFDTDVAQRCVAGQRWVWDGVEFEVLHPRPAHYGPQGNGLLSSNAMSCVLRVASAQHSAWLGGDIDAAQETRLALARPDLRATVVLAPHHGSLTSSSPVLLNTLRPRWVLVQSGYRNRFHHPASAVLERYRQRGIRWVNSPDCGAAMWRSAEPDTVHCQRAFGRRYWHHAGPGPGLPAAMDDGAPGPPAAD